MFDVHENFHVIPSRIFADVTGVQFSKGFSLSLKLGLELVLGGMVVAGNAEVLQLPESRIKILIHPIKQL